MNFIIEENVSTTVFDRDAVAVLVVVFLISINNCWLLDLRINDDVCFEATIWIESHVLRDTLTCH